MSNINCDECGTKITDPGTRNARMCVCTACYSRYCGNGCGQHYCPKCSAKTVEKRVDG